MASHTLNALRRVMGAVHYTRFRAILTQEIKISAGGVALGTGFRDDGWIILIPVPESLRIAGSVPRASPFFCVGYCLSSSRGGLLRDCLCVRAIRADWTLDFRALYRRTVRFRAIRAGSSCRARSWFRAGTGCQSQRSHQQEEPHN
jgi:hypothetical protein